MSRPDDNSSGLLCSGLRAAALLVAAVIAAGFAPAVRAGAPTIIHSFDSSGYGAFEAMLLQHGTLYGVLNNDSDLDAGGIFSLAPAGGSKWGFDEFHRFNPEQNDGGNPHGALIEVGGDLFGTTFAGGSHGNGTVFGLKSPHWPEKILHSFNELPQGGSPDAGLAADARGNLFGVALEGSFACGDLGCGLVFELAKNSAGTYAYKILHKFSAGRADGNYPTSAPVYLDGHIYGATSQGGKHGAGIVYELTPASAGKWTYQIVHDFSGPDGDLYYGNGLTVHNGSLYGTTGSGGAGCGVGCGVIFKMTPPKTASGDWSFVVLYKFKGDNSKDGAHPVTPLAFGAGGTIYGATEFGGGRAAGTLFMLDPGGKSETVLYRFSSESGCNGPVAGLTIDPAPLTLFGLMSTGCGPTHYGYAFSFAP